MTSAGVVQLMAKQEELGQSSQWDLRTAGGQWDAGWRFDFPNPGASVRLGASLRRRGFGLRRR